MQPSTESLASPAMMDALRRRAAGRGAIGFGEFMDVALYEPGLGYYRRDTERVGTHAGTDFVTSTSSPLFGRLVSAACAGLLRLADPGQYDFIEVGAERGSGVLSAVDHPFRSARLVGIGDTLEISGPAVVFSNELLDAQPFRRFRKNVSGWRELGVTLEGLSLREIEIEGAIPEGLNLPPDAEPGYLIDAPLESALLTRRIAAQPWEGLFVAFDYGKPWEQIAYETPAGTARSYRRHVQGNDLLAYPGEQDLTCDVCWDWIGAALIAEGFAAPQTESQEAFFVKHAAGFVEALLISEAAHPSRDKLALLQLLHPVHMGQRFQAHWALKPNISRPNKY